MAKPPDDYWPKLNFMTLLPVLQYVVDRVFPTSPENDIIFDCTKIDWKSIMCAFLFCAVHPPNTV